MKTRLITVALCLVAGLLPPAFAQTDTSPGSIQGVVYLTMEKGDLVPGTGIRVALLRVGRATRDSLVGLCQQDSLLEASVYVVTAEHYLRLQRATTPLITGGVIIPGDPAGNVYQRAQASILASGDTALSAMLRVSQQQGDLKRALISMLFRQAVATSRTGVHGDYRFNSVRPGHYTLFAALDTLEYLWWKDVAVQSNGARADLNERAAYDWPDGGFCRALTR